MLCSHIKIILILVLITLTFIGTLSAPNKCKNGICNHEAICEIKNGVTYCSCIGDKYFFGKFCTNQIDNCSPNPCLKNASCTTALGQPICGPCAIGTGGHLCDVPQSNIFTKLYIHHNRYGYFAEKENFLMTLESLGSAVFLLEFHSDNYAIDAFKTEPKNQIRWKKSTNLASIARQLGLHHADKLPYNSGYYYVTSGVFWTSGLQTLRLKVTDVESLESFMENSYKMNIVYRDNSCHTIVELLHCSDPFNPLRIDVKRYNLINAIVRKRCWSDSKLEYDWAVYNTIETILLYSYKRTTIPRLKIHSYSSWTRHLGELMQSYMIRVSITEKFRGKEIHSVARCYIFILSMPVVAQISGGQEREVNVKQPIRFDGSNSRDYALSAVSSQRLSYIWTCKSKDDPNNKICTDLKNKDKVMTIPQGKLKKGMSYKFSLEVQSHINVLSRNKFSQTVKMVTTNPLFVDIKCIKNCETRRFVPKNLLHLMAVCLNCGYHTPMQYTWTVNGVKMGSSKRLVIKEPSDEDMLKAHVEIVYRARRGKATLQLLKNDPPMGGECKATPTSGEEMNTEFQITCYNFNDDDRPLNYEFSAETFSLDRCNDPSTRVYLPSGQKITVNICDSLLACTIVPVEVNVEEFTETTSIQEFLSKDNRNLGKLFNSGAIELGMTVAVSSADLIVTNEDAMFLASELLQFELKTLLELEQFFWVFMSVINKISPINNDEAKILSEMMSMIAVGFQNVINDGEIRVLPLKKFTIFQSDLALVLNILSDPTERIQDIQILRSFNVHMDRRMEEEYAIFDDFDKDVLPQLFNWVLFNSALDTCIKLMGLAAAYIYEPEEPATTSIQPLLRIDTIAFENRTTQMIETPDGIAKIVMSSSMIFDLQAILQTHNVVIQRISTPKNPFWWYPDLYGINTGVVYLSGYSTKLKGYELEGFPLADALEITLKLNVTDAKKDIKNHLRGRLLSNSDMNIFKFYVPKNALLKISFVSTMIDLEVLLEFGKMPTGYRTHKSNNFILKNDTSKKLLLLNAEDTIMAAYLGVVPAENVNDSEALFVLVPELRECLSWSFSADDPSWTTDKCWPEVVAEITDGLHCHCKHMSIFAGKIYPTTGYGLNGVGNLVDDLPINWHMLSSQILLGLIIIIWVVLAFLCLRQSRERLVTTPKDQEKFDKSVSNGEIIIRITTGGYRNASTTAGIILIFTTSQGPLKFKVYQNPKHPQLRRHSTCTVRLPLNPDLLIRPISVHLKQDGGGRYPSWYCRCLEISYANIDRPVNINVSSWVDEIGVQLSEIETKKIKYKRLHRFTENLEITSTNWFFYNPLFGPWKYGNMTCNRFERTLVWMLKAALNLVIVSLAYGWTTLQNYEEERDKYRHVSLDLLFTIIMSLICFAIGSIIQFGIQYWVFKSSHESYDDSVD